MAHTVYELGRKLGSRAVRFSGIHYVVYLSIDEIASVLLLIEGEDTDRADFLGCTPLIWAAINESEDTIKLFLKWKDIIFKTKDVEMARPAL